MDNRAQNPLQCGTDWKGLIMNWTFVVAIAVVVVVFLLWRGGGGLAAPADVAALLPQRPQVIDVRTPGEYRDGHLANARNLPLADLGQTIGQHEPDKARPILLYCASGARSAAGKKTLEQLGYASVHNLGSFRRAQTLLRRVP